MSKKSCAKDGAGKAVDCGEKVKAQGRCHKHYQQWYRAQDKCKAPGCKRVQAAHYYCRPHEQLALTTRSEAAQRKTLAQFRNFIVPDFDTGCWLWTGAMNPKGYGVFFADGTWLAHRFAYVWFIGGHPPGKVLDHICNTKLCVRPDHLWAITNTNNLSLMHQRAAAESAEFWRHSSLTPLFVSVVIWAAQKGLPCRKPKLTTTTLTVR